MPYTDWVSGLRSAYSQREKSALRMKESGSSSWPTARASEQENRTTRSAPSHGETHGEVLAGVACDQMEKWFTPDCPNGGRAMPKGMSMTGRKEDGTKGQVGLANQAQLWTTPQAHDVSPRGSGQVPTAKAGNACLARDAMNWPTPMAGKSARNGNSAAGNNDFTRKVDAILETWGTPRTSDGERGGPNQTFGAGGTPLPSQAANWPTPSAMQDTKGDADIGAIAKRELDNRQIGLAHRARLFSRPDPATIQRGLPSWQWRPISRQLLRSVTSHVALTSLRRWLRRGGWRKRRLNPIFVGWLMGWPKGHALCACSATEWSRWQRHMRGALSALPTASAGWIWEPTETVIAPTQGELF